MPLAEEQKTTNNVSEGDALPQNPQDAERPSTADSQGNKKAKPRQTALFDFSNTEAIKEKVRQARQDPNPYDVHDCYHDTGTFQFIARHMYFENTTLAIIVVNALWISIDTDGNTADTMLDAKPIYVLMDTLFFTYFLAEVIIRFCAFKNKCDCLRDGWFKFDSILVALYAFDPFTLALITHLSNGKGPDALPAAVLRLFRLARLSRLVRMLRSLPELMIMIKGMITATSSVCYTMALLMIVTYIFAIALRNLVPGAADDACAESYAGECIETKYFSTVPESMHNLIIFGTFCDELQGFIWEVKDQSPVVLIVMWIYISLASLTILNMLIGVLCEVISAVAAEEKESMMCDKIHDKLGGIVSNLDKNNDGYLSWEEFQGIIQFPEALAALESVGVDAESMVDFAEDSFFEDGVPVSLTFNDFMDMVLDLRGGQEASVQDCMRLSKRFTKKIMPISRQINAIDVEINTRMDAVDSTLNDILKSVTAAAK